MNRKKYLIYIITFFIIVSAILPIVSSFAEEITPTVNAPVALLIDSRYW